MSVYKNETDKAFYQQRAAAKMRGVAFDLTFEQWFAIWSRSGKLSDRGCKTGQYVMARYNDVGPYAVGNVKIIRHAENTQEGRFGRKDSLVTRARKSAAQIRRFAREVA